LHMWSASAVGRPAFAPGQVHRPSVILSHPPRDDSVIIYNSRRSLLPYRVRVIVYIYIVCRGVFSWNPKSNKTSCFVVKEWDRGWVRERERERSRESLEKSFVTNFERDQLLRPTLCTQRDSYNMEISLT